MILDGIKVRSAHIDAAGNFKAKVDVKLADGNTPNAIRLLVGVPGSTDKPWDVFEVGASEAKRTPNSAGGEVWEVQKTLPGVPMNQGPIGAAAGGYDGRAFGWAQEPGQYFPVEVK